jgi:hypothetical protein
MLLTADALPVHLGSFSARRGNGPPKLLLGQSLLALFPEPRDLVVCVIARDGLDGGC